MKLDIGTILIGILAVILVVVIIGLSILMVQSLWNYLMPELFNFKEISYKQALAMYALFSVLFWRPTTIQTNKGK